MKTEKQKKNEDVKVLDKGIAADIPMSPLALCCVTIYIPFRV